MPRSVFAVLVLLTIGFVLYNSWQSGLGDNTMGAVGAMFATPVPAHLATDQAAGISSRATIAAGTAQAITLINSVNMARSTQEYLERATLVAGNATATAIQYNYNYGRTVVAANITATSIEESRKYSATSFAITATRLAKLAYIEEKETALRLQEMELRNKNEEQQIVMRAWLIPLIVILVVLVALFLIVRYVLNKISQRVMTLGKDGKPYFVTTNRDGSITIVDITKTNSPTLVLPASGKTSSPPLVAAEELTVTDQEFLSPPPPDVLPIPIMTRVDGKTALALSRAESILFAEVCND